MLLGWLPSFSSACAGYFGQPCTHFYFHFTYFVNLIQFWGTNNVIVVVVVVEWVGWLVCGWEGA